MDRQTAPNEWAPIIQTTFYETDPNGKVQHEPGAKLDAGKAPIFQGVLDYFPRAIEAVAQVSALGATKYAWKGWETVPDGQNRYRNAQERHTLAETKEGLYDKAFLSQGHRVLHRAQVAWNALAALELLLRELGAEPVALTLTGASTLKGGG